MHYFTLTTSTAVYTCLSAEEARKLQDRIGGLIAHQFSNPE